MHEVTDFGEWLNEVMLKIGVTLLAMLYVTAFHKIYIAQSH